MKPSIAFFGPIPKVVFIVFIVLFIHLDKTLAQQVEVLLSFQQPSVGNVYVNSIYDEEKDEVFIPVIEMFNLLEINVQPDVKNFTIKGNFITTAYPYVIDLSIMLVQCGKNTLKLTQADFRLGETDYYISPKVFEDVFGLNFTANIDQLVLKLETSLTLPIQTRKARELSRNQMGENVNTKIDFPLGYKLNRSLYSGSMVDYSINCDYASNSLNLGYAFTGGVELLGGDLQGTINGVSNSNGFNTLVTNNLLWRYAIRDNDFISGIMAGQTSTTGLQPLSIKGISLTNDPIEPRQIYETTVIDGTTEPESEVELYVNERLSEFQRADAMGYYRFNVPISYGTTRTSLHIYTPSGQIIVSDKQMQVPFTFLPKGVASYNIQAGLIDNYTTNTIQDQWTAHGNFALGVTNWLTTSFGTQYLGNTYNPENFLYYGSMSARVAKQYLINIDAAPNNFYRLVGSVNYSSNLSMNISYTKFDGKSIFNSYNATDNFMANIYLPFRVHGINTGFRLGTDYYILPFGSRTTYRTDLNMRLGKADLRLNYRDNLVNSNNIHDFGQGTLTSGITYTMARTPGIPVYIRGMYVRAQTQYNMYEKKFQTTDVNFSRTISKTGRLDLNLAYNHLAKVINSRIGLTLDLNTIRSVTSTYISGKKASVRQSLTGSLGWDMPNEKIVLSNRQQVGRSSASVILFIDNNNSGKYEKGDKLLPYRGVKLDKTTTMLVGRDSILRLTQLQSYYKYNLSVNRNAIPDPTLVPIKDNFSFIADPNQFKQIEIPFYRGGIAEGAVFVERDGKVTGQGGLRLVLKAVDKEFQTIVRTMSDGNFYVMDLAPGKYTMEIDSIQLGFLNVKCEPEKVEFEIKALAEGDYVEGLTINLIPIEAKKEVRIDSVIQPVVSKETIAKLKTDTIILQKGTTASVKIQAITATKDSITSIKVDTIITPKDTKESLSIITITAPKDSATSMRNDTIQAPLIQPKDTMFKGLVLPKYLGEPLILRNKEGKYSINLGTFSQLKQTDFLVDLINKKSPDKTLIINTNGKYSVRIGYFDSRKEAETVKASMVFRKNPKK